MTDAVGRVLALFFRELAVPYPMLRPMAECATEPAWRGGPGMARWIQFGGLHFLLITSRAGLLLGFPFWVAALYLPLAVLGLAGWRGPVGIRVTATLAAYLVAFSLVGAPSMNFYWGAIYAPLLAFRDSCARIV